MPLQDPAWTSDPDGAIRRAGRVLAFHAARRAAGRPGFTGLHFDVEPHTEEARLCAEAPARRETGPRLPRGGVGPALAGRPGFGGLAVFAHGQPFDAPLVTSLEGRVLDREGRPVAGARDPAAGQEGVRHPRGHSL